MNQSLVASKDDQHASVRVAGLLRWSPWCPPAGCWRGATIPNLPGVYRVRRAGRLDLDYVGQTGGGAMKLRRRLAMLRGVYADHMPYRDPHTAAPALWSLRRTGGGDFEVSVAPVEGPTPWRKGLEALAIALHRQEHGRSPTVQFGRMPGGFRASSSYNRRLLAAGRVVRGGPSDEPDASQAPGIAPVGPLDGEPQSQGWGGHRWSGWASLGSSRQDVPPGTVGLYRIRGDDPRGLLYVGQGLVGARLAAHAARTRAVGHRQGAVFAAASLPECSWVLDPGWLPHHLLELENDLIAAHVLALGTVPPAQFLG